MELDQVTHAAHEAYINHAMRCQSCNPPTKRYCFEGKELQADYLANYLMSLDLHTRRKHLARVEAESPNECEALKARLIVIHEQGKQDDLQ